MTLSAGVAGPITDGRSYSPKEMLGSGIYATTRAIRSDYKDAFRWERFGERT